MTYEERVHQLAEKMAKEAIQVIINGWKWEDIGENSKEIYIRNKIKYARIAIAEMAEVVRKILSPNHSEEYITNWLLSEGLIPKPEGKDDLPQHKDDKS